MIRRVLIIGLLAAGLTVLTSVIISLWAPLRWWRSVPSDHGIRLEVCEGTLEASTWQLLQEARRPATNMQRFWGFGYESFTMPNLGSFDWRDEIHLEAKFTLGSIFGPSAPSVLAESYFVPLWPLAVLLLAYPALASIRGPVRRWRRRKRGLCIHCGYNLTGLTEPRCPECGRESDAQNGIRMFNVR